ncbi:arsenosugar biosynthesis radical SAM (seleno)protein ArsS [Desertivirga brevis]|uniref:arsenosugar biosynthesis radical SAM (seleno)protein ArsS n=1 Tax=Desertivirga brevis TaxID=2810310 RepID=UPI001A960420|nr:arsenosugar biosynthesis radical SAM (seleno)protein ArsS [Pedobacter sp. SYSU D00873]
MKSLKAQGNTLAEPYAQLEFLEESGICTPFQQKLEEMNMLPLNPKELEIFQVNIGKMCNQVCKHCHVDAGPDRKEIMTEDTMLQCLDAIKLNPSIGIVDITGGAPEMNPSFRWFVKELNKLGKHIIVRCNLTIIVANKKYNDLPEFFKEHGVEIVSSLPFYTQERTDRQRGNGVFEDSIRALKMLNAVGYGMEGSSLILNLVYNPAGAFLPPSQNALENEYKQALREQFAIEFNNLFVITNIPVSRYLDYLISSGNYEKYMERLRAAFNPSAVYNVMCRNTISVSWDGFLYDCDFNQMLDLRIRSAAQHISEFNTEVLNNREIVIGQHCYGCTAGAGSSCGGATV